MLGGEIQLQSTRDQFLFQRRPRLPPSSSSSSSSSALPLPPKTSASSSASNPSSPPPSSPPNSAASLTSSLSLSALKSALNPLTGSGNSGSNASRNNSGVKAPVPTLRIDRLTKEISAIEHPQIPRQPIQIFGILGIFKFLATNYVGVITQAKDVGSIQGHSIYQIKRVQLLPFKFDVQSKSSNSSHRDSHSDHSDGSASKTSKTLSTVMSKMNAIRKKAIQQSTKKSPNSEQQFLVAIEGKAVQDIIRIFSSGTFYFSYDYDLTNSLQRRNHLDQTKPPLEQLDSRFWWNQFILSEFINKDLTDWILPVVQGYASVITCEIQGERFDLALLSRRSRMRAGLRYKRRGVDSEGNCANFVETEQIMSHMESVISYVQIRGSIPLFWSQHPLMPKPKPILLKTPAENYTAMKAHLEAQFARYGHVTLINLVEKSGKEAIIGEEYGKYVEKLGNDKNFRYVAFDFHEVCKGSKFDNLKYLIAEVNEDIKKSMFYWKGPNGMEFVKQETIFRVNCMDCLDRTNVVQSMIAREVVNTQLMKHGLQGSPEQSQDNKFDLLFNLIWTENGDAISTCYSGTSALKRDLTKFGKRTKAGIMNDGMNSLTRLYKNNFKDSSKQVTIDYILGIHEADIFVKRYTTPTSVLELGSLKVFNEDAVQMCRNAVLPPTERTSGINEGWLIVTYLNFGHIKSASVERVFIISNSAYYICCYNYEFEEVVQHQRVELYEISKVQRVKFASHGYGLKVYFGQKEFYFNQHAVSKSAATVDEAFVENSDSDGRYHVIRPQILDSDVKEKASEEITNQLLKAILQVSKPEVLEEILHEPSHSREARRSLDRHENFSGSGTDQPEEAWGDFQTSKTVAVNNLIDIDSDSLDSPVNPTAAPLAPPSLNPAFFTRGEPKGDLYLGDLELGDDQSSLSSDGEDGDEDDDQPFS